MDQIQQFSEPCKQFMKDSIRLVKKCTKPDRKGKGKGFFLSLTSILIVFFSSTRISKDRYGYSYWFCHYGIYWFLR